MQFKTLKAVLIKRYKRFLADVMLDGHTYTIHVPNSGSMLGLAQEGCDCYISPTPQNKLPYRLEIVQTNSSLVGVNTHRTEALVLEAFHQHVLSEFVSYTQIKSQVTINNGASRLDYLLQEGDNKCYVEVKNVTYVDPKTPMIARFPDAVTVRGQKHLKDLVQLKQQGFRSVLLMVVNRNDCTSCSVANKIDHEYAKIISWAMNQGVEVVVAVAYVQKDCIQITHTIPFNNDL